MSPSSIPETEKPTPIPDQESRISENTAINNFELEAAKPTSPPSEFTLRACLNLAGAFSVLFCSVGFINAFGVFQETYQETLLKGTSASSISWIGSFNLFCIFGGALGTGMLNDKYGPRYLIFVGTIITLWAVFMVSICTEYYQFFLAQGLLLGLGLSALFCPAIATLQLYFRKNRAFALGICISGSSIGGVIWPIALHRLIDQISFGWALRISAFIMLPLLIFSFLTIKPPISNGPKPPHVFDFSCAKHPVLLLTAAGFFFTYFGLFTPFFYITPWAVSQGIDADTSFYMISVINATSLFGRILPGLLADRLGVLNTAIIASAISGVITACMKNATSLAGIVIFSMAYGFTSGAIISLQAPCATKVVEPKNFGTAIGVVTAVLSIAGLVGTPIVGQLLQNQGWLAMVLWSGLMMILGSLCLLAARLTYDKRIWVKA